MKVVILAGGKGTRISEHTKTIPKPMIKIGSKPILEHIINYYKKFGTLYVPAKIWFSFENMSKKKDSLMVNFSNIIHKKSESINKNLKEI